MGSDDVLFQRDGAVATITLKRPQGLNATSLELWHELHRHVLELKEDTQVKVVVLKGAGEHAFSVGMDMKSTYDTFATAVEKVGRAIHGCCRDLMQIPQVVIAVVHGYCFGGSLELMLSCDYVIATGKATFSMPEMKMGLPCMVEAALLVPTVGLLKAKEMCYFARTYDAEQARMMRLVNEVVKTEEVDHRLAVVVQELLAKDASALAVQKDIIYKWLTTDLESAMQYSILAMKLCQGSPAQMTSMKAFLERKGGAS